VVVPHAAADVVVLDIGPGRTVEDAIADGFTTPAVVLLDDPRLDLALALLRAGASAVLARQSDERELIAAIDAAAAGLLVVDAAARDGLGTLVRAAPADAPSLTEREREVLDMLAEGLSNKRIAQRLRISEHTVKFHVGSILGKLGAATRAEAVRLGVRLGYVML
jgi:DNA-binding NarL/FixJ family response regulator